MAGEGDKEPVQELHGDPFRVRLVFSTLEQVKMLLDLDLDLDLDLYQVQMVFLGLTLVPLRFLCASISLTLAWAVSCVGLMGLDNSRYVRYGHCPTLTL